MLKKDSGTKDSVKDSIAPDNYKANPEPNTNSTLPTLRLSI